MTIARPRARCWSRSQRIKTILISWMMLKMSYVDLGKSWGARFGFVTRQSTCKCSVIERSCQPCRKGDSQHTGTTRSVVLGPVSLPCFQALLLHADSPCLDLPLPPFLTFTFEHNHTDACFVIFWQSHCHFSNDWFVFCEFTLCSLILLFVSLNEFFNCSSLEYFVP